MSRLHCCSHLKKLFDEKEKRKVVDKAYKTLKAHSEEFDAIAVSGMSMALIGPILAWRLNKKVCLVRKPSENSHSSFVFEGYENQRVAFVDDLIATGNTFRYVETELAKRNCKIVGIYLYWDDDTGRKLCGITRWFG